MFNLKFAAKELDRNSRKCEKDEKQEKLKCKKAIQKGMPSKHLTTDCLTDVLLDCLFILGNIEGARIHAENAIRQKNQALNYLRMSARIDAVASRVQTALTTKKVTQSLGGVVKAMDGAMKSMNLEKISQIMDKFEKQFEDLDVQTQTMENAMSSTTTITAPENQIDTLMQQVADEAGYDSHQPLIDFYLINPFFCYSSLELNMELPSGETSSIGTATAASTEQGRPLKTFGAIETNVNLIRVNIFGTSFPQIYCIINDWKIVLKLFYFHFFS